MANDNKKVTNNKNKNTKTASATKKAPAKKVAAKKANTTKKTTAAKKAPVAKKAASKATPKAAPKKKTAPAAQKKASVVTTKKAAKKVVNNAKGKNATKKVATNKNTKNVAPKKVENKVVEPKKIEKKVEVVKEEPKKVEKVASKKDEKKVVLSTSTIYTIIGLAVLAIVVILTIVIKPSNSEYSNLMNNSAGTQTTTNTGADENIPEDKRKELNSINIDQYLEMLKGEETKIIYIGRPTCSHCVKQKPVMENIAFEYDVTINYLNTDELDDDGISKLISSNEYFSDGFGTPLTLIVKDNKIVDKVEGETSKADLLQLFKNYSLIK